VAVILEGAQRIEHHKVADVQVRRRRVEAQLYPQLVAPLQAGAQVVFDFDLDRPLAQAPEKIRAHTNAPS